MRLSEIEYGTVTRSDLQSGASCLGDGDKSGGTVGFYTLPWLTSFGTGRHHFDHSLE